MIDPQEKFMRIAIEEALKSKELGDYAVGACIVHGDKVIAKSGNRTHLDQDPTHHAEVVVIREAAKILGRKSLHDCVLYVTHEPCPMCASATIWARVMGVISGAKMEDMAEFAKKNGNEDWKWRTISIPAITIFQSGEPKIIFVEEFLRDECKNLFHS
ncbi:MAG: hypothetical protein UW93_C0003G0006 [Parcubacteria group bacterium GW2011_GWC1_45_13]|uniref:CMP/dCMP-type deaminase domain-containing protein n=3 Tax=Patescibacteria group TaxID=1783273 RepID=A0A0G1IXN4_9BACT|nr:MAG: hypothetical protein UW49_C0002G0006 [Candidatus Giovannonibacteria bacterium GW2011_GWB1_44_23]KKT64126.1 MAG: hypothetical protein UW57_C0002G0006 [Candidatus Giovannonibacteria bacterium GW2011_GWA1_44_29]KKT91726.1 MAG: hypothetical protein UW93_C0003G0006 [Parcubacteria group bacterium GW2011_GWC1_45_13]